MKVANGAVELAVDQRQHDLQVGRCATVIADRSPSEPFRRWRWGRLDAGFARR
jgi:hypothetical protein